MQNLLLSVLSGFVASAAFAQTPPPEVSSLVRDSLAPGTVTVIKSLTAEQRAFIWKDTSRSRDGYLRVQNTPSYLNLVADFRSDAKKTATGGAVVRLRPSYALPDGLTFTGAIHEDQYRTTLVFDDFAGGAVLTVWNFQKAGAKVSVIEEVLNQAVAGHRATLALNVAHNHKSALWKLAWWTADVGYELYVPDVLNSRDLPARRSQDIVALAAVLANQLVPNK
jgi:hypothetical protein